MSDPVVSPDLAHSETRSRRGQSLVEFALVLPMLLVLLLGIADFGRVFQAGITLEGMARNAAEVGALERLRNPPPTDPSAVDAYYRDLHLEIAKTACDEMEILPKPDDHRAGPDCQHLTAIRVCVHDGTDPRCGVPISGMNDPVPPACKLLTASPPPPWPNASGGEDLSHAVEVQVCYQFTTLFTLDLALPMSTGLTLGDVYLERSREFVVDCPPNSVSTTC